MSERGRRQNAKRRERERGVYPKGYRHVDYDPDPEARQKRVDEMAARFEACEQLGVSLFPEREAS